MGQSFSWLMREELAHGPPGARCCRIAELGAALRLAGVLEVRGGAPQGARVAVTSGIGSVVRRLHASVRALAAVHPDIEVHTPSGLHRRTRYRLVLDATGDPAAADLLRATGFLDHDGRPTLEPPPELTRAPCDAAAFLRGALLAAGHVSDPQREAQAEISAPNTRTAGLVEHLLRAAGVPGARVRAHRDGWRVTIKSGPQIGRLLLEVGAHTAFLHWDQGRLRRELRAAANRAANADRANLSRAVAAASRQVAAIGRVVAAGGWDSLSDDLREVALARIANPEASLAELGGLLEPPAGKVSVHRRMTRLTELADKLEHARVGHPVRDR